MKRNTSLYLTAGFGIVFVITSMNKPAKPDPQPVQTVFDTALMMLKEFIVEGNDSNLGFHNFDELDSSSIRQDEAIDEYYLREDTLLSSAKSFEQELIPVGRKIYPVYAGNNLRSAITFQSTPGGWKPIIFANAQEIDKYIADRHSASDTSKRIYSYIMMPFIHSDVILRKSTKSAAILRTHELEVEEGEDLPPPVTANDGLMIDEGKFVTGLIHHMKTVHGM
jgi:hypothetical protein